MLTVDHWGSQIVTLNIQIDALGPLYREKENFSPKLFFNINSAYIKIQGFKLDGASIWMFTVIFLILSIGYYYDPKSLR